jgi:ribosome-associated protein
VIHITDTTVLDDHQITERFVRASRPGGELATQEATAVELRFDIGKSSLPADVKARLTALAGRHVTTAGVLVVVSRADRSQAVNRETARRRLLLLLKRAATPPKKRKPTKVTGAQKHERLVAKERRGAVKRVRSGRDDD